MSDSISSSSGSRSARASSQPRTRGGRFRPIEANAVPRAQVETLRAEVQGLQAQAEASTSQFTTAQTELNKLKADLQAAASHIEVLSLAADRARLNALAANAAQTRAEAALRDQQRQLFERALQSDRNEEELSLLRDKVAALEASAGDAEVQRNAAQAEAEEHHQNEVDLMQRLEQATSEQLRLEAQLRRSEEEYAVSLLNLSERHAMARRAAGDSSRPLRPGDVPNQERRTREGVASLRYA